MSCKGMKYAKEPKILEKAEVNGTITCFITLKDQQANFLNHNIARLINLDKNEIKRIKKFETR